jgi:hypothetical protein
MTIAIGYRCHNGVVLAADTLVIIGPDVQEGQKLDIGKTANGSFAFVNSSMDANATATLIADICHGLQANKSLTTYRDVGNVVKTIMTEWRRGFGGRRPPETQLILGAKLFGLPAGLFLCEPPNTFLEKDDYVAVGAGASVTDPLYKTLFGNNGGDHTEVHSILRRVAYLVYRAKKDSWMCGKATTAALVHQGGREPTRVRDMDMDDAEANASVIDFLLGSAAIFALDGDEDSVEYHASSLGDMLKSAKGLRSMRFHEEHGSELVAEGKP